MIHIAPDTDYPTILRDFHLFKQESRQLEDDKLTPQLLHNLRSQLDVNRLLIISGDLFAGLIAGTEFLRIFQPEEKLSRVVVGRVGSTLGLIVLTDAYEPPHLDNKLPSRTFILVTGNTATTYTLKEAIPEVRVFLADTPEVATEFSMDDVKKLTNHLNLLNQTS